MLIGRAGKQIRAKLQGLTGLWDSTISSTKTPFCRSLKGPVGFFQFQIYGSSVNWLVDLVFVFSNQGGVGPGSPQYLLDDSFQDSKDMVLSMQRAPVNLACDMVWHSMRASGTVALWPMAQLWFVILRFEKMSYCPDNRSDTTRFRPY